MMGKDLASGFLRLRAAAEGKVSSVAVPVTFLVAFLEERKVKTRTLYEPNAKGAAPKSVQAFRGSATRRGGRSRSTSHRRTEICSLLACVTDSHRSTLTSPRMPTPTKVNESVPDSGVGAGGEFPSMMRS